MSQLESDYIQKCLDNANHKLNLENDILYTRTLNLPLSFNKMDSVVHFSTLPGSLETYELVMDWIRDLRLNHINNENIFSESIHVHEGFVTLYALNSLRRTHNPNFLYYYGVVRNGTKLYPLSEYNFNTNNIEWIPFKYICQNQKFDVILSYYLSILFSLHNANREFRYTNYNLCIENIMMKTMSQNSFDVEYLFGDKKFFVTNHGYIPVIMKQTKSYVKVIVDGQNKSFGYNNTHDIPFETQGIYTDRGFVITDAYKLLMGILEITFVHNREVYDKFLTIYSYFSKESPEKYFGTNYFIPYYDKTSHFSLTDLINHILNLHPSMVSNESQNDVLKCVGFNLEIKSQSLEYYTAKNTIQLYDFLKFYSHRVSHMENQNNQIIEKGINFFEKYFEVENLKREKVRQQKIRDILYNHDVLYEIPEDITIFDNDRYTNLFLKYIDNSIMYLNTWERTKTGIKILQYLRQGNDNFGLLFEDYSKMVEDNHLYHESLFTNLIKIRVVIRNSSKLKVKFSKVITFLETLASLDAYL